jgi:predicted nucleic acid binding AN1-type Zn finger protein
MEFYNLGKHCQDQYCRQQDFLPFVCDYCNHAYCKEHHHTHQCEGKHEEELTSTIPICPVCTHPVPKLYPQESNDLVIHRHLESGKCGTTVAQTVVPTRSKDDYCHWKSCSHKTSSVYIKCNGCNAKFCLDHRLAEDHSCASLHVPLTAKLHREKARNDMKKQIQAVRTNTSNVATPAKKKITLKKREQNSIIAFTNTPQTAVLPTNRPNLERQDQVHLPVFLPLDKYHPMYMYFPAMSSVGKCIDMISEYAKLEVAKNGQRLRLYNVTTRHALPTNKPLRDLIRDGELAEYSPVLFAYCPDESPLSDQIITELEMYLQKRPTMSQDNCRKSKVSSKRNNSNAKLVYVH